MPPSGQKWHVLRPHVSICIGHDWPLVSPWLVPRLAPGRPLLNHLTLCGSVVRLYFLPVSGGNLQHSALIQAAPLWGTKTKQTLAAHLIKEVKLVFETNPISVAACLFTLTDDPGGPGPRAQTYLPEHLARLHSALQSRPHIIRDPPTRSRLFPIISSKRIQNQLCGALRQVMSSDGASWCLVSFMRQVLLLPLLIVSLGPGAGPYFTIRDSFIIHGYGFYGV